MLKRERGTESDGKLPHLFVPSKTAAVDPGGPVGYHTRHWIRVSQVQTRPGLMDFSERKNPEYDFIPKGSKTVGPMS